ncbi:MAG: tetratricopeptide repeat protein [Wenzhouxiangellaceae bacterium]|nr:tetratricopeptide repeat protein [Wenzhouxiangellaceae bacterium]
MDFQTTVAELKRRHVFRVMGAYTVSFWVVLQVGDVVLPAMMAPAWIMKMLIGIGIVGAPVVAVLSWFYELTHEGVQRDTRAAASEPTPSLLSSRWIDYVIIAALVVILAIVLMGPSRQPIPEIGSSIAVMPFRDLGADEESRYLGYDVAETITDQLARIDGIRVTARSSAFALGDEGLDARATAERLGVETLLEGSVRRAGNELRISARLIDGRSGTQVWSETFGGTLENVFDLQDRISREIARAMQIELDLPGQSSIATVQPEAYDEYLRGRDQLRRQPSADSIEQAIAHLMNALRIDPDFGLASAALCRALWENYELNREPERAEAAMRQCLETQTRFPERTETQVAIASLHLGRGQLAEAGQSFQRALRGDPNNAEAHAGLAATQLRQGQFKSALDAIERAIALDPAEWRYPHQKAQIHYSSGKLDAAAVAVERALQLDPDNAQPWNIRGAIHFARGEFLRAGDAFEQSITRQPNAAAYSNAGTNYFFAGQFARAEAMFRRASEMAPGDPRLNGFLAWSIRIQGNRASDAEPYHRNVIRTATQRLEINVNDHEARSMLAMHLAALSYEDAARGAIASLADAAELDLNALLTTGFAHYLLGDEEQAAEAFDQAIAKGMPFYLLHADPRLKDVWNRSPFDALRARHQAITQSITQETSR